MILDALYLFLDLFTLSFPLLRSWDPNLSYAKKWYALFPAIGIVGAFFLTWDVLFTKAGIWGFNDRYLIDIQFFNLPLEEWLFFLVVPFACIFIYEASLFHIKKRPLRRITTPFFIILALILMVVGVLNLENVYTSFTFILTSLFIAAHLLLNRQDYLDRFLIGYLFSLVPFFLVNGILTGSFIEGEIVWYNNAENLGIRLGSIPIEDAVYLLLYLLMITTIYERILNRFSLLGVNDDKVTISNSHSK